MFTGTQRAQQGRRWFSFPKADRRVTCYYFYLWDDDFGPAFVKICAYFPYPAKIWLLWRRLHKSHYASSLVMSRGSSVADRGSRHRLVGDCGGRIIGGSSRCFRHRDGPGEEATMNEGCRVRVTGPLAGYVDGFRDELAAQGYTVQVRDRQLRMLAHVSRWMAGQGLSVAELTPELLEDFLDERRREGYHHALSRRAVMPLMEHVRAVAGWRRVRRWPTPRACWTSWWRTSGAICSASGR